jgi:hypothetical protein
MKKIKDFDDPEYRKFFPKPCRHPEHNPPQFIYLEPGIYEHTCPGCGAVATVVIPPKPTLSV